MKKKEYDPKTLDGTVYDQRKPIKPTLMDQIVATLVGVEPAAVAERANRPPVDPRVLISELVKKVLPTPRGPARLHVPQLGSSMGVGYAVNLDGKDLSMPEPKRPRIFIPEMTREEYQYGRKRR